MKLKQKPEDFLVTESWRFTEVPKGEFRVYAMDKQKLSTFDAIGRVAEEFKLPRSAFSFCGLKDKQGRTRQLIAVRGVDVDYQDEDMRLKFLGRTDQPLSAENTTSNRFGVTIRGLTDEDVAQLPGAISEVNRLGVVNYFDSQRFGSLKHGQGFIAKDLLRGDFEMALRNYLKPSELDRTHDAKVKAFWRDRWGEWRRRCTIPGAEKYERIIHRLRQDPQDFRGAFLQIDPKYRAMLVFTYQSWLWNEGVRRFLVSLLPGHSLLAIPYQAGKLLFPRDAPLEVLRRLRKQTFPLLAPDSKIEDPEVRKAVDWVLGREKLSLEQLQVPQTPSIFFRHEERPVVVYPGRLFTGPARQDELNHGYQKVYLGFTLPPGSYATLVVRRVFFFSQQVNAVEEPEAATDDLQIEVEGPQGARRVVEPAPEGPVAGKAPRGGPRRESVRAAQEPREPPARRPSRSAPEATPARGEPAEEAAQAPAEELGFRARRKLEKQRKAEARAKAEKAGKRSKR